MSSIEIYNPEKTTGYVVDEYVNYDRSVYRCRLDTPKPAGPFDDTYWNLVGYILDGSGVINYSGETTEINFDDPEKFIYTTGNQTISGVKTFTDVIEMTKPEASSSKTSEKVVTVGWVNDPALSENVMHKDAQNIINRNDSIEFNNPGISTATNPTSNNYGSPIYFNDMYGNRTGYLRNGKLTSGNQFVGLQAYRKIGTTDYYSSLDIGTTSDGTAFCNWQGSQLVTLGREQTFTAKQTFNDTVTVSKAFSASDFDIIKGSDTNGKGDSRFLGYYTGNQIYTRVSSYNKTSSKNMYLDVISKDDGNGVVTLGGGTTNLNMTTATAATNLAYVATMGWTNDPTKSTNVVHRTGDETITGTKTFQSNAQWPNAFLVKSTQIASNYSSPSANMSTVAIGNVANDGTFMSYLSVSKSADGITGIGLNVRNRADASGSNRNSSMSINIDKNGNVNTYAPSPSATDTTSNNNIATVGWVNDSTKSTNVVHRTSNETITGTKTFTAAPKVQKSDPTYTLKNTDIDITVSPCTITDNNNNVYNFVYRDTTNNVIRWIRNDTYYFTKITTTSYPYATVNTDKVYSNIACTTEVGTIKSSSNSAKYSTLYMCDKNEFEAGYVRHFLQSDTGSNNFQYANRSGLELIAMDPRVYYLVDNNNNVYTYYKRDYTNNVMQWKKDFVTYYTKTTSWPSATSADNKIYSNVGCTTQVGTISSRSRKSASLTIRSDGNSCIFYLSHNPGLLSNTGSNTSDTQIATRGYINQKFIVASSLPSSPNSNVLYFLTT